LTPSPLTSVNVAPLECRKLSIEWRSGFADFCRALEAAGDTAFFQPHPFTDAELDRLMLYRGLDLYYIVVEGPAVLGYGLLRGWDEGYAIPSLGIAIHPAARSSGLGLSLMHFLHAAARRRGAAKVRLRVRTDNTRAVELYKRFGYSFDSTEENYYVGFKGLLDV
jgi:ribosomal-protein-alanine N-acetyltransferase